MVKVPQCIGLYLQLQGKHSEGVLQRGHAHAENLLDKFAFLDKVQGYRRVGIGYKHIPLKRPAVSTYRLGDASVFFFQFCYVGIAYHLAAQLLYLLYEAVYEHVARTSQPPAALYETAVAVGEGEQGQRLFAQLHLQTCSAYNVNEEFAAYYRAQVFVGICLLQPSLVLCLQHFYVFFQSLSLLGEILRQFIDEIVVSLRQLVGLSSYGDFVKATGV